MFRTQDLVISALPKAGVDALRLCLWGTRICIRPTIYCRYWPTFVTCWRWTPITCWRGSCGIAFSCYRGSCPLNSCIQFTCGVQSCPVGTCPQFSDPCGGIGSECIAVTQTVFEDLTTVVNPEVIVLNDVADLKTLRTQLTEVMDKLSELEEKGLDAGVQTPEELDQAEAQLKKALEEVQAQRKKSRNKK